MGRAALDEDAIRLIEAHNPDVDFDWTRILKGQDAPAEPRPSPPPERRGRPRPREVPAPASAAAPPPMPSRIEAIPAPAEPEPTFEARADDEVSAPPPKVLGHLPVDFVRAMGDEPMTAAQARLGSEGLSRLRARHAEVLARISEKVADQPKRDELKSQAERLNPDTWVTDAEVTAGLEAYESVFESLRAVVGRRRKRGRRQPGPSGGQPVESSSDGAIDPSNDRTGGRSASEEGAITQSRDGGVARDPAERDDDGPEDSGEDL